MAEDDASESKKRILARRARFVAAALASAGIAAGADACSESQVCLSMVYVPPDAGDSGSDAQPQPCLTALPPDSGRDSAGDAPSDAPSDAPVDANDGEAGPTDSAAG